MLSRAARAAQRPAVAAGTSTTFLAWLAGAVALAFAVPACFSGALHWRRDLFVVADALFVGGFLFVYSRWTRFDPRHESARRPSWGVGGALIAGALLVWRALEQPATPGPTGARALFEMLWLGVVDGSVVALLLSVLPVHAAWQAATHLGWTREPRGAVGSGAFAIGASLLVALARQIGFGAHGGSPWGALLETGVMTVAYLFTGNPIAPIGARIAVHVAAILHAYASPALPPGP